MDVIKKTESFNYIYKKAFKIYTKYSIIFIIKSNKQEFGFVTSKKVGNAVRRNRVRRVFREVVRLNIDKFNNNFSYVFVAKNTCEDITYSKAKDDILRGIKKYEKNSSISNK